MGVRGDLAESATVLSQLRWRTRPGRPSNSWISMAGPRSQNSSWREQPTGSSFVMSPCSPQSDSPAEWGHRRAPALMCGYPWRSTSELTWGSARMDRCSRQSAISHGVEPSHRRTREYDSLSSSPVSRNEGEKGHPPLPRSCGNEKEASRARPNLLTVWKRRRISRSRSRSAQGAEHCRPGALAQHLDRLAHAAFGGVFHVRLERFDVLPFLQGVEGAGVAEVLVLA